MTTREQKLILEEIEMLLVCMEGEKKCVIESFERIANWAEQLQKLMDQQL